MLFPRHAATRTTTTASSITITTTTALVLRHLSPAMQPSPSNPQQQHQHNTFPSPESLSEWLRPRLPPDSLSTWGLTPGTKTLHNLWLELSLGESSLSHDPVRTVHVATVRIVNPSSSALLLESHQLLSDGTIRSRLRPLSEKMLPGESIHSAASRAVSEELGGRSARILHDTHCVRVEDRPSFSYPGLPSRYVLHSIDAEVDGLPEDGEFETSEAGEEVEEIGDGKVVVVKKHYWKWVLGDEATTF